jgi:hypothetical protein
MRNPTILLALVCAMALPAFCQTEADTYPDTWQARQLKACGAPEKEANYTVEAAVGAPQAASQSAGKALVYVIRPRHGMTSFPSKIAVDGEWKGANLPGTYFSLPIDPGLHYFCSSAKSKSLLIVTLEAGKTYYLEQQVIFKPHSPVHNLFLLREPEAKPVLALAAPSSSKVQ